jgi:hypothetical protein
VIKNYKKAILPKTKLQEIDEIDEIVDEAVMERFED